MITIADGQWIDIKMLWPLRHLNELIFVTICCGMLVFQKKWSSWELIQRIWSIKYLNIVCCVKSRNKNSYLRNSYFRNEFQVNSLCDEMKNFKIFIHSLNVRVYQPQWPLLIIIENVVLHCTQNIGLHSKTKYLTLRVEYSRILHFVCMIQWNLIGCVCTLIVLYYII